MQIFLPSGWGRFCPSGAGVWRVLSSFWNCLLRNRNSRSVSSAATKNSFKPSRAALIADYQWPENLRRVLYVRFHRRNMTPIIELGGWVFHASPHRHNLSVEETLSARVERVARAFSPHLTRGFASHSVVSSPFGLSSRDNEPKLRVEVQGPFTAHELIESYATLRVWLAHNAPQLLPDWS